MEHRLAAIVAADMVGYSRLMEMDERGTLARLRTHRIELIDPVIEKNNGRIIKTTGDGMLVEFHSVADAVRAAIEIQDRMRRRNSDVPADRRIEFRIGINLGDIIFEDGDVYRRRREHRRAHRAACRGRRHLRDRRRPQPGRRPPRGGVRGPGREATQEHHPSGAGRTAS